MLRLNCPEGQLRSKGHGKLSIHFAATQETIETVFRIVVSANQLSLYRAGANMCEEYESHHDRSGRPDKVMGQSIVLSAIKTEVSLENDEKNANDAGEDRVTAKSKPKMNMFSRCSGRTRIRKPGENKI